MINRKTPKALLLAGLIVAAGASAAFAEECGSRAVMLLTPAPVAGLKPQSPVAVKGNVAEIFGNRFILQDDSGRTLVDLGPDADAVVTKGETVTVQGMFDRGSIRAVVLVRADGRAEGFGPANPPPKPDRGPPGPRGPRAAGGPGAPPPPPAPGAEPPPPPPRR